MGQALPDGEPLSNSEILAHHPDTSGKPAKVLAEFKREFSVSTISGNGIFRDCLGEREKARVVPPNSSLSRGSEALHCSPDRSPECVIMGSTTSCRYTGSQATAILGRLGVEAPAYETEAGCSTSLASLSLAQSLLISGYRDVLVSCAETLSKIIHPEIPEIWFGLADGGAALWLERAEQGTPGGFEVLKTISPPTDAT